MSQISIAAGASVKYRAVYLDAAGNETIIGIPTDTAINWTMSDAALATLDVSQGAEATITAGAASSTSEVLSLSDGTLSGSVTIDITAGPAVSIGLVPA